MMQNTFWWIGFPKVGQSTNRLCTFLCLHKNKLSKSISGKFVYLNLVKWGTVYVLSEAKKTFRECKLLAESYQCIIGDSQQAESHIFDAERIFGNSKEMRERDRKRRDAIRADTGNEAERCEMRRQMIVSTRLALIVVIDMNESTARRQKIFFKKSK